MPNASNPLIVTTPEPTTKIKRKAFFLFSFHFSLFFCPPSKQCTPRTIFALPFSSLPSPLPSPVKYHHLETTRQRQSDQCTAQTTTFRGRVATAAGPPLVYSPSSTSPWASSAASAASKSQGSSREAADDEEALSSDPPASQSPGRTRAEAGRGVPRPKCWMVARLTGWLAIQGVLGRP